MTRALTSTWTLLRAFVRCTAGSTCKVNAGVDDHVAVKVKVGVKVKVSVNVKVRVKVEGQ
ncbi:MAG TPA: hypothetical protein VFK02_34660 [Kofleriaceae bacterium]|nr:hypothetical protein [Kofleriaceae bacterium]